MAVIVISYARPDQPLVRAVVKLLRGALRDFEKAVYWDDDFEPGEPWFEQIRAHIDAAPQLFVFWCVHSAESEQVRREFEYAFQRGKRVVPVLMDRTKLCRELADLHGIDLRPLTEHAHALLGVDYSRSASRSSSDDDLLPMGIEYSRATNPARIRFAVVFGLVATTIVSRYITQPSIPLAAVAVCWILGLLFLYLMRNTQIRVVTRADRRRRREAELRIASQFAEVLSQSSTR
jgi:hypothetical protein